MHGIEKTVESGRENKTQSPPEHAVRCEIQDAAADPVSMNDFYLFIAMFAIRVFSLMPASMKHKQPRGGAPMIWRYD